MGGSWTPGDARSSESEVSAAFGELHSAGFRGERRAGREFASSRVLYVRYVMFCFVLCSGFGFCLSARAGYHFR